MQYYMLVFTYDDKDYFLYENNQFVGSLVESKLDKQLEKFSDILGDGQVAIEKYDADTLINLVPNDEDLAKKPELLDEFVSDDGTKWLGYLIYE